MKKFQVLKWAKKKNLQFPGDIVDKSAKSTDLKIFWWLQKKGHVMRSYEQTARRMAKHLNIEKATWLWENRENFSLSVIHEQLLKDSLTSLEAAKFLVDKGETNWCEEWLEALKGERERFLDLRLKRFVKQIIKGIEGS
jgi:hypothetical protein